MTTVPHIKTAPQGPEFSKFVQGYWRLSDWGFTTQECLSFIKSHLDLGITTVDHAHVYGNPSCEVLFGEALKLDPSIRDNMQVISKCGIVPTREASVPHYNSSAQAISWSVETSLCNLGIESLDVLLIHRPDYLMDSDEIADAFNELQASGKVQYFGVSNFSVAQWDLLQSRLNGKLVTNQIELNPVNLENFENGILERLQTQSVRPMAWSCLAGGKLFTESNAQSERLLNTLHGLAEEFGISSIEPIIYAWVLKIPSRPIPILGSRSIERIRVATQALQIDLTHEQWYKILKASRGHDVA